ncbi:unnamed protein product [Schistosoma turkestanicum]|nr:unnamed protein product [Schistosoma turkestanicum]
MNRVCEQFALPGVDGAIAYSIIRKRVLVHSFPNCSQQLPTYENGNTNLELINHPNRSLFLLPIETDFNYNPSSNNKIPGNYWFTTSAINNHDNNNHNHNSNNNNCGIVNMQTNGTSLNLSSSSCNMMTNNLPCTNMNNLYHGFTNDHNSNTKNVPTCPDGYQTFLNGQYPIPFSIPETCGDVTNISKHPHILMATTDNWPKLPITDFTSNIVVPTDCDSGNGDSVEIQPHQIPNKICFLERT